MSKILNILEGEDKNFRYYSAKGHASTPLEFGQKSIPYGMDEQGGGSSKQPYIESTQPKLSYSIEQLTNYKYKKVLIEIDENSDFEEFKKLLDKKGETEINLILNQKDKKYKFKLENLRKFDLKLFNEVKSKEYVKKIVF